MKNYKYSMHSITPKQYYILTKDLDYKDSYGPAILLSLDDGLNWHLKIDSMPLSAIGVLNIVKLIFDSEELNIKSVILDVKPDSSEFEFNKSFEFKKSAENKVEDYYEPLLNSLMFSCR